LENSKLCNFGSFQFVKNSKQQYSGTKPEQNVNLMQSWRVDIRNLLFSQLKRPIRDSNQQVHQRKILLCLSTSFVNLKFSIWLIDHNKRSSHLGCHMVEQMSGKGREITKICQISIFFVSFISAKDCLKRVKNIQKVIFRCFNLKWDRVKDKRYLKKE